MTLQDIQPTSETWTRHAAGMQWFAAYRIDIHHGQHVAVLSRWTDAIAAAFASLHDARTPRADSVSDSLPSIQIREADQQNRPSPTGQTCSAHVRCSQQ